MSDSNWESMNEKEFDDLLRNSLDEMPPEKIVDHVTPWRKAMNEILIGLALNSITLNYGLFQYFPPAIGLLLMLLGFRTLRLENRWFRSCWIIAVIRSFYVFPLLVLNTLIVQSEVYASGVGRILTIGNLILVFVQYVCLWKAMGRIQKKAGLPVHTGSAASLIIWYSVICFLGLMKFQLFGITGIVLVTAYICISRSLCKMSRELDEAGYAIETAPVSVSDWTVTAVIVAAVSIGMVCSYRFGGRYPMNWSPMETKVASQIKEIKEQLLLLGFPENVLDDLTEEDIKDCAGALRIEKDVNIYEELCITGIAVQLPGEQERWKIFHHFMWKMNTEFYGTDCIQLWPAYRDSGGWKKRGEFSGRLLYDGDGQTYTAPYHSLEEVTYTTTDFFGIEQSATDIFAAFSLPRRGGNRRGYVSYTVEKTEEDWLMSSWINYTHQSGWAQYPVKTALEYRELGGFETRGFFRTVQEHLEFDPKEY